MLRIHVRNPHGAIVRLSANGLANFTGHGSVDAARASLKRVARHCLVLGCPDIKFKHFKVQNVTYDLGFKVDICEIAKLPGTQSYLDHPQPHVQLCYDSFVLQQVQPVSSPLTRRKDEPWAEVLPEQILFHGPCSEVEFKHMSEIVLSAVRARQCQQLPVQEPHSQPRKRRLVLCSKELEGSCTPPSTDSQLAATKTAAGRLAVLIGDRQNTSPIAYRACKYAVVYHEVAM